MTFEIFHDDRGSLLPIEFNQVPFPVQRIFVVRGIPGGALRGNHLAQCEQLLVLIEGRVTLWFGESRDECTSLDHGGQNVWIRSNTFISYQLYDERSSIVVLASEHYRSV